MRFPSFDYHGRRVRLKTPAAVVLICLAAAAAAWVLVTFHNAHSMAAASLTPTPTTLPEQTYDAAAAVIDVSAYEGTILAETEDAGQDYIDSTLFLGDSNTARFMRVQNENGETFTTKENTIGVVGMGIDAISTLKCMQFTTGLYTMPEAVKILQPERVIITFGTNNLSGSSTDATSFITRYTAQIQTIEEAYPSVDIIINSIPPVARSRTYTHVTMTQIDAYNKAIVQMCEDNGWKYLNSAETLKGTDGYAQEGFTISDGLHLSAAGLSALFDYIRTHAWITEDDRPKPLTDIPGIIGVPAGLIQTDPLTNAEFTSDPAEEEAVWTAAASTAAAAAEEATPVSTPTPSPSAASTSTAAATSTPTASAVSTPTPSAADTPTPTTAVTPEPTAIATPTATAVPTATAAPTATAVSTPTPSPTSVQEDTSSQTEAES
jgi:hypothetical protein